MKARISLMLLLLGFIATAAFSQNSETKKTDRIIRKDFVVIDCTITKMTDNFVEYSLPNETLVTELDLSKVGRIEFASGRIQTFDAAPQGEQAEVVMENMGASPKMERKQNTIAVLPVPYVNSETMASSEEVA